MAIIASGCLIPIIASWLWVTKGRDRAHDRAPDDAPIAPLDTAPGMAPNNPLIGLYI